MITLNCMYTVGRVSPFDIIAQRQSYLRNIELLRSSN